MEEKKIKPYKGKPLDEWIDLNKMDSLKTNIETHCETVLEAYSDRPYEDAILLTRIIMTSLRDWFG